MNRAEKRKTIRIVNKNLEGIYNNASSIAKGWDRNTIPLTTLKEILDKSKPSIKTDNKTVNEFNLKYSKTLDLLYSVLSNISANMNSKDIALSEILKGIIIIKDSFKAGISE